MTERREWTLESDEDQFMPVGPRPKEFHELVHVVEVREGERVLSREELREAFTKHFPETQWPENAQRLISVEILEREIFEGGGDAQAE
jgi:hypothetical protein